MEIITQVAEAMQTVLITKANQLAQETGFIERERTITGSTFVVGLVSGYQANPATSLEGLSQALGNAGTPISRQGLNQRFTAKAVKFLRAMVQECIHTMVAARPVKTGVLARFSCVELTDSTIITVPNALANEWRGSGGYGANASTAAMKLSVRWNMSNGRLQHLNITEGIVHDRQVPAHTAPVPVGSLQIRDLGYFKLDDLAMIDAQDACWLMRYKLGTAICTPAGDRLPLLDWLSSQEQMYIDQPVRVGRTKQLPARLVAERVPPAVVQQRRERIVETARKNQTVPSQRALAFAQWTIYLTNVSPERLCPAEIFDLGRYRWQIELLFKLWKSDLHLDKWQTTKPQRILCEIFGKLIAVIVTHWLLLVGCWHNARRSLRQSMASVQGLAWQWANSLNDSHLLLHTLRVLRRALARCRMDTSRKDPRAFQLLAQFPP